MAQTTEMDHLAVPAARSRKSRWRQVSSWGRTVLRASVLGSYVAVSSPHRFTSCSFYARLSRSQSPFAIRTPVTLD